MRAAHNKLPEDILIKRCNDLGLNYVKSCSENQRTYVYFTCDKHKDMGVQRSAWYHFKNAACGCKYCAGKCKTSKILQKELDEIGVPVTIIGEYKSAHDKILYRCNLCGKEHSAVPNSLLSGTGCPDCGLIKRSLGRRKDDDTFIDELKDVQPNIEVIGEYTLSHSPIKCRCVLDGTEWESYPVNLLNGSAGCPTCRSRISRGERAVMQCLDTMRVEYKRNYSFADCRRIHPLRCDFYLPHYNIVIEFDGRQHFEEIPFFKSSGSNLKLTQERDRIKDKYCNDHGIHIVRIPYYDLNNVNTIITRELESYKNTA